MALRDPAQPVEMPKLPPDVFTNFSPYPQPPAVNVLLLDSLNTRMEGQSVVHKEAMKFLKGAKPGTRTAIFTMGLALHFIQGFNDDPAVLAAALNNKKNIEVETPVMLKSQAETNAESKIPSLAGFFADQKASITIDREFRTLANLQRLAAFLQGFPGRKNIIWFAEKVPGGLVDSEVRMAIRLSMMKSRRRSRCLVRCERHFIPWMRAALRSTPSIRLRTTRQS